MRWKPPSERVRNRMLAPIVIPLAVVGVPVILTMVGLLKLYELVFPERDWHQWFAWRPVRHYRRDCWMWLEPVERRRMWAGGEKIYRPILIEDTPNA